MKKEVLAKCTDIEQVQRVYGAYNELRKFYEDMCDGPNKARDEREYMVILHALKITREHYQVLWRAYYGE